MILKQVLTGISYKPIGDIRKLEKVLSDIVFDSRKANADNIFVATQGTVVDGHDFIDAAIANGVELVLCESLEAPKDNVLYLMVDDSKKALGLMACNFYEHPSQQLKLVGVTGTNGKTSTVTLLYKLFMGLQQKAGLISTVENRIGEQIIAATHTTPDAMSINRLLAEMRDAGCEYVFMEVSSHAVDQDRIAGLDFAGAIFTNLSHDHLDYHGSFQNYIYAKKKFFDQLSKNAFALINIDDKRGSVMVQNTMAKVYSYSLRSLSDFKAKVIENTFSGLILDIDDREVFTRLVGNFNAYNLLAVYAAGILLEEEKDELLRVLSQLTTAEGRFETVSTEHSEIMGIVDYAHTPDALEKVLQTLHKVRGGNEQIITVVGCGGDRDKTKRPIMAKVACDYSDQVILTSDNPRTENPEEILKDMQTGIPAYASGKVLIISDRKQAIHTAVKIARKGDVILVAGKGHEKYQEINGVKYPFDDKEILAACLAI